MVDQTTLPHVPWGEPEDSGEARALKKALLRKTAECYQHQLMASAVQEEYLALLYKQKKAKTMDEDEDASRRPRPRGQSKVRGWDRCKMPLVAVCKAHESLCNFRMDFCTRSAEFGVGMLALMLRNINYMHFMECIALLAHLKHRILLLRY